jgi:hypothetical protein
MVVDITAPDPGGSSISVAFIWGCVVATFALGSHSVTEAFYRAAAMAGYAPSIRNRQPWRWILGSDILDLHLDRGRLHGVADRQDRLALMSCGAALHHARVGLAAYGWSASVEFPPGGGIAGHLARLRIDGVAPNDLTAVRLAQLMPLRRTDRHPAAGAAPAGEDLAAVGAAVTAHHGSIQHLCPDQLLSLAADRTGATGSAAEQWNQELADWADGCASPRPVAAFSVLHGPGDLDADWMRAGEALAAGWLAATGRGVSVLPLSAPAVDAGVSARIRAFLAGRGRPYLVVRLLRHTGDAARRITSRLPERQLIERGG